MLLGRRQRFAFAVKDRLSASHGAGRTTASANAAAATATRGDDEGRNGSRRARASLAMPRDQGARGRDPEYLAGAPAPRTAFRVASAPRAHAALGNQPPVPLLATRPRRHAYELAALHRCPERLHSLGDHSVREPHHQHPSDHQGVATTARTQGSAAGRTGHGQRPGWRTGSELRLRLGGARDTCRTHADNTLCIRHVVRHHVMRTVMPTGDAEDEDHARAR